MIWHTKVCVLHLNTDINRSSKSSFTRLDSTKVAFGKHCKHSTRWRGCEGGCEGTELWQQFLNALITPAPLETKTICVALWVVHNRVLSPRFIMNSQSRSTSSACTQSALKNKLYLIVCYVRVCVCVCVQCTYLWLYMYAQSIARQLPFCQPGNFLCRLTAPASSIRKLNKEGDALRRDN